MDTKKSKTQHKIGQSFTLFSKSKPWVCQSLLNIPNAACPLVPQSRQVCGHNQVCAVRAQAILYG